MPGSFLASRGGSFFPRAEGFSDATTSHPYSYWIARANTLKLTGGCGPAVFCPERLLTRGELAIFAIRLRYGTFSAFTSPAEPYFTDVPANHPYFSWIQKARQAGIVAGCAAGRFCPDGQLTRGELAAILARSHYNKFLAGNVPYLSSVTPSSIDHFVFPTSFPAQADITVTGVSTNFASGVTTLSMDPSTVFSNIVVVSPTVVKAHVLIGSTLPDGYPYPLVVRTGAEEVVLPNAIKTIRTGLTSVPPAASSESRAPGRR